MSLLKKSVYSISIACLIAQPLFAALVSSTPSMMEFATGEEKLTIYTNVPGHEKPVIKDYPSRAKSDIYEIWVRSAATENEWVQCFTHMTYNRALEMPDDGRNKTNTSRHAYQLSTAGWTHTFANIEMSDNSPVEVEIRKIGETLLNGQVGIEKSAVHPIQKVVAGSKKDETGRVYFKIYKPGQLVIDINGQMDDHNYSFPEGTPGGAMKGNPPVHSVAIYANPIIAKPPASGDGIRVVKAGEAQPKDTDFTTLIFSPGVHIVDQDFKLHPGKNYYIPGDAILYGSLSNAGVDKGNMRCTGDSINLYGYGVINGIRTPHYQNRNRNEEYPEWNALKVKGLGDVGISINDAWDVNITGITVADPANFNTAFGIHLKRKNDQGLVSWVKLHSWRVNGDGFGGYSILEDSFVRSSDDSTYVRAWRKRCTFWKDTNANQFRFVNHIEGGVEDCDILYSRWRHKGGVGNIFDFVSGGRPKLGVRQLDLHIRNNRFHDKLLNPSRIIHLASVETLTTIRFEDMAFYLPLNKHKSIIHGTKEAPYTGEVMFKNITFQNGLDGTPPVKLTKSNYKDYFNTNEFVDPSIFED